MVGIPKSTGCQVCKRRKVKCDENWPSCLQCRRMKADCPGPTKLSKFINTNTEDGIVDATAAHKTETKYAALSKLGSSAFHMRKVHYANVNDPSAEYGRLKMSFPQGNPTTLADRVGLRLISSVERGPAGVTTTYMAYLPELPRRLAGSPCLRDSVDLFCTAWADFRSPRSRRPLIMMPQYGKMLRSLRRALMDGQENRIETLAAMTLLERTARLFDQSSENADIHLKGIRDMFVKKSLPNLDDELDVKVTNEVHALLLKDWAGSSENPSLLTSPQKEALSQRAAEQLGRLDFHPFLREDVMFLYGCAEKLTTLLIDFQQLCRDPANMEMVSSIRQRLYEMKSHGHRVATNSLERGVEDGAIKLASDKSSLVMDKRYHFSSLMITGLYHAMLMCQLIALSMLHHLDTMYGTPNNAIIAESRKISAEIWRMIPAIKSLEPVIAVNMLDGTCMSYEFAHNKGREYVLESILDIDSSVGRFPKEKESLHHAVMDKVRLLTGRKLNQPIQGLVLR